MITYFHHGLNPNLAIDLVDANDRGGWEGVNTICELAMVDY